MNGPQDMGGLQCFGPVIEDKNDVLFHHPWQQRVFAMTLAMGATGSWNLDQSRFARESVAPDVYLNGGYYRIWLSALEALMKQRELISEEEIQAGQALEPAKALPRVVKAELIPAALAAGSPVTREPSAQAEFSVGQPVRVSRNSPSDHTRVPRYVRGCVGEVVRVHGCHVFADSHARGEGENPHWLYNVCFDAANLWGDAAQRSTVNVDIWEPCLEHI